MNDKPASLRSLRDLARTALALTSTALAVLFAAFLAAYCLRLIGPACRPLREPGDWEHIDAPLPGRASAQTAIPSKGEIP